MGSMFQSTHPCGVRLDDWARPARYIVSIHAPVWGATVLATLKNKAGTVSIHAPVWGATTDCWLDFIQN